MRSILKTAFIWGCAGFALALLFYLLSLITEVFAYVELVFWPGSFAFMALDNSTTARLQWVEGTVFLILTNFAVYFVVGLSVTLAWKGLLKLKGHYTGASGQG